MTEAGPSVVHVGLESPAWRMGGLNRYLTQLSAAQRSEGTDARTIWITETNGEHETPIAPGLSWPKRLRAVSRAVRASSAEIVDVHFPAHAYWAVRSGALRRRPLIVHFQGPWSLESRTSGEGSIAVRLKAHIEGYVLRRADRVVTLSSAFRRVAIERYGVAPQRVEILHPGVASPTTTDRAAARSQLGVTDDEVLWLSVRRLVARMGLGELVTMFDEVRRPGERLVIVGDGPERAGLERLVAERGLDNVVHFTGGVDDTTLESWYLAADVSIVPSVAHEGFGLVVYESLAHGTPVVASDLEGLRDAARGCVAVRLIELLGGELRHAVDTLLADPAVRSLAEEFAAERDWSTVAASHSALYQHALSSPPARGVVVLDHSARRSGGELAMARLMYALDQRHWRAHVILAEHGPLESELEERGISYEVLALSARTNDLSRDELTKPGRARAVFDTFAYAVALRRRVRHRQPDVVHSNSMKAHVYGTIASFGARWALVMHVRDRWSPPYLSDRLARALRLLARFGPDAVLANSSATAKATGVDATVLASPVESHFFAVESPEFPSTIRLGVLGRLAPWKGQDLVITALGQLPSDVPWHLSVAGDALFGEEDYAEGLREQVRDAGLEDRVSFLGHVENVAGFLEGIDVSILTSRSPEPFGNVVVEAMAAGRTVVVPNQGGVTEFVTEGGPGSNGFFYEMDDADSLARVLRRVMVDPDVRWFVGSNARRSAAQFRVERVAQTLEAFYDDLV